MKKLKLLSIDSEILGRPEMKSVFGGYLPHLCKPYKSCTSSGSCSGEPSGCRECVGSSSGGSFCGTAYTC